MYTLDCTPVTMSDSVTLETVGTLKVVELRAELEKRGLDTTGLKKDLAARLSEALSSQAAAEVPASVRNNVAVLPLLGECHARVCMCLYILWEVVSVGWIVVCVCVVRMAVFVFADEWPLGRRIHNPNARGDVCCPYKPCWLVRGSIVPREAYNNNTVILSHNFLLSFLSFGPVWVWCAGRTKARS